MKQNNDKSISRIFKKRAKQKIDPKLSRKLRENLRIAVKSETKVNRDLLLGAFGLICSRFDKPSHASDSEYVTSIQKLISIEYTNSASVFFMVCITFMANIKFKLLTETMPNDICINHWIKHSKTQKTTILKSISSSYDKYYKTAWCDWYIKKSPVKGILQFAIMALKDLERPQYLLEPSKLLVTMLSRDRKFVLTDSLKIYAIDSPVHTKALLLTSLRAHVGEVYARSFGYALASKAIDHKNLMQALSELLRSQSAAQSEFSARFIAHVTTTLCLVSDSKNETTSKVTEALQNLAIDTWLLGKEEEKRELWFTSTTKKISKMISEVKGEISTQGALQIALSLRAAQTDTDAKDALWASAFNLGIKQIGKTEEIELFDPLQHEDIKGGLLPGDKAQIVNCGWVFSETVLLRAQVTPADS